MRDFIINMLEKTSVSIFKVNFAENTVQIWQYKSKKWPTPEKAISLDEFIPFIFSDNNIVSEDRWRLELLRDSNSFLSMFHTAVDESIIYFTRIVDDKRITTRVKLLYSPDTSKPDTDSSAGKADARTADSDSDNKGYALLFLSDVDSKQAEFMKYSAAFSSIIYRVIKCDFLNHEYTLIKDFDADNHFIFADNFINKWEEIIEDVIHPDDIKAFRYQTQTSQFTDYFDKGNKIKHFYYRRKIYGIYRWVKFTALPDINYSASHRIVYFCIEDANDSLQKMINTYSAIDYMKTINNGKFYNTDAYYENLQKVLHLFTDSFVDFYMIDLEKDLYIKYKQRSGLLSEDISYIGSYTETSERYIANQKDHSQDVALLEYSSSEKIIRHLAGKATLSYTFKGDDGKLYKTTCQTIEVKNGTPTKVICYTVPDHTSDSQLKIRTFGNFEIFLPDGSPFKFSRKQCRSLFAYLIDKRGFPVTSKDIVTDVLEKDPSNIKALKYVSTLLGRTMRELNDAGFGDVIVKEQKTVRVETSKLDCDYYHLMEGDIRYWSEYHNEYMKEYSWAEDTNAEIIELSGKKW